MELHVQGVHYHVSDVTREHIEKKVERFGRLDNILRDFKVVIKKETSGYTVEIMVNFSWGGEPLFISSQDEELWPLIDVVFDKADLKISREKDKHQTKA